MVRVKRCDLGLWCAAPPFYDAGMPKSPVTLDQKLIKGRENKCRRHARRHGLTLVKVSDVDDGRPYMLLDADGQSWTPGRQFWRGNIRMVEGTLREMDRQDALLRQ